MVLTPCGTNTLLALPDLLARDQNTDFQVRDVWLSSAILKNAQESVGFFFFFSPNGFQMEHEKYEGEHCSGLFVKLNLTMSHGKQCKFRLLGQLDPVHFLLSPDTFPSYFGASLRRRCQ